MKKIYLLLVAVFISITANAQKIETDVIETNGDRYIFCSYESIKSFTDKITCSVGLSLQQRKDKEPNYYFCVSMMASEFIEVPQNGRMLLKTKNGEVIELNCYTGSKYEIKQISGMKFHEIKAQFGITPEQIVLLQDGVIKIRIELKNVEGNTFYEKEFKKDKIGKIITKEYDLILNALQNDKKASFSDGF